MYSKEELSVIWKNIHSSDTPCRWVWYRHFWKNLRENSAHERFSLNPRDFLLPAFEDESRPRCIVCIFIRSGEWFIFEALVRSIRLYRDARVSSSARFLKIIHRHVTSSCRSEKIITEKLRPPFNNSGKRILLYLISVAFGKSWSRGRRKYHGHFGPSSTSPSTPPRDYGCPYNFFQEGERM